MHFSPFCFVIQYGPACRHGQHSLDIINCDISILTVYMYQNISNVTNTYASLPNIL